MKIIHGKSKGDKTMKKYFSLAVLSAGLMLTACSSDNDIEKGNEGTHANDKTTLTITAGLPDESDAESRVAYNTTSGSASATWESGDELWLVNTSDGTTITLTLNAASVGKTSGRFTTDGTFAAGTYKPYAVSKDSKSYVTMSGGTITMNLASQDGTLAGALKRDILKGNEITISAGATSKSVTLTGHVLCYVKAIVTSDKTISALGIKSSGGLYTSMTIAKDGTVGGTTTTDAIADASPAVDGSKYTAVIATYPKFTTDLKISAKVSETSYTEEYRYPLYENLSGVKDLTAQAGKVLTKNISSLGQFPEGTITDISKGSHEWVRLVADGLKWATMNLGATAETGTASYGYYYEWGATAPYPSSQSPAITSNNNTTWSSTNTWGYFSDESDITAGSNNDKARQLWGGSWTIPAKANFDVLAGSNYTWTRVSGAWSSTTPGGYIVAKTTGGTGKSLFLPAAGYWRDGNLISDGTDGNYWSSKHYGSLFGFYLRFFSSSYGVYSSVRYNGSSVRPVSN